MWSDTGLRVTAPPAFMPDAPPEVRALYRRHARGNSLFRNRGDGTLRGRDARGARGDGALGLVVRRPRLRQRRLGGPLRRQRHADAREGGPEDLDGFFWRQVVARSPLTRVTGTPYDDAWRAMNQLPDPRARSPATSATCCCATTARAASTRCRARSGLDLDQDGRSFAVLDLDGDGDPDLAVMAARQAPQLRVFRNDFEGRGAALAVRLRGTASNRDAVGRARQRRDRPAAPDEESCRPARASCPSTRRSCCSGSARASKIAEADRRVAERAARRSSPTCRSNTALRLEEGGELGAEPFAPATVAAPRRRRRRRAAAARRHLALRAVPGARLLAAGPRGADALARGAARASGRAAALVARRARRRGPRSRRSRAASERSRRPASARSPSRSTRPTDLPQVRAAAAGRSLPVVLASREVGLSYAILNRHLFMNRQDLRLPTASCSTREGAS